MPQGTSIKQLNIYRHCVSAIMTHTCRWIPAIIFCLFIKVKKSLRFDSLDVTFQDEFRESTSVYLPLPQLLNPSPAKIIQHELPKCHWQETERNLRDFRKCFQIFKSCLCLFSVMSKCKVATWDGKISGARCSNPRVQQVTPAASLSRTPRNAPLPTQGPPLTGVPARGPAEFLSGRSLNSP